MKIKISIIIPCYNSGKYLPEALESIKNCNTKYNIEVIIVDDGSTDGKTLQLLSDLENKDYTILFQENKGPAAARNTGVKKSNGEFLLFLDSDNRLRENYLNKGIPIFNKYPDIGVIHGKPDFFGESPLPRFKADVYDKHKIVFNNYIDMCVLMRKKVWNEEGEFDEDRMVIGHEDWEYWIRLSNSKWKFYFLNEVCFDYRVRKDSLIQSVLNSGKLTNTENYIFSKYRTIILQNYKSIYSFYNYDINNPVRAFVKNVLKKVGVIQNKNL